jgi:glycosyltransferase involved in cell wall biosynthesis
VSLRIFVVAPFALLTDHRPHGDGLVACGFIRELAARGHELVVAVHRIDVREAFPPNVHIHLFDPMRRPGPADRIRFMWRMRQHYERLARTAPFDLVHQLNPVDAGLSLALADVPVPVVLGPYVPEWPMGYGERNGLSAHPLVLRLNELIRAAQQRRATTVLLSTPAAATKLATPRLGDLHIRQVSPGIDDREWAPGAEQSGTQQVLFLANLRVRKGILVLLDAFGQLAPELPSARLVVAGDGPLAAEVRRRVGASSALRHVELLGRVERAEAPSIVRACSVFCLPSFGEPYGMTALEAMACAKPIVSTNAGGMRHLVPEEGGRRVPPGDARALAHALREIIVTPELQRAMGEHNRRTVEERYTWARSVDCLEEAYHEAIAQPRRAVSAPGSRP